MSIGIVLPASIYEGSSLSIVRVFSDVLVAFLYFDKIATTVRATWLSKIQNSPSQSWLGTFKAKYGN